MREDIQKTKLAKLEKIKVAGINPYPEKCERNLTNAEALKNFKAFKEKKTLILVCRIKSFRLMGNA
ncbi:MAG TPA: hypothetical protein ENL05_00560 [Candidatus Moranbacteria bacterium]|nr:hypothetical protein [Candidatus Moranbacteria bacterium]